MKARRRIEAFYHGRLVGELATNGQQTLFQYGPDWLRSGEDLSPLVMPRREAPILGDDSGFNYLPPLFADSLPDRYGRQIMMAWFKNKHGESYTPTPLDFLAYVGEAGMGALTYRPVADAFPEKTLRQLDLHSQERLVRAVETGGLTDSDFIEKARRAAHTVGGAFPKVLCAEDPATKMLYEDDPRLDRSFRRWIIKIAQETRPLAAEIEFAFNRLAKAAGIEVPESGLMRSQDENKRDHVHFAIERFDWQEGERVHFSSLASLTGVAAGRLQTDYLDFFSATHELTRDVSQVEEAFRRMVFNVAVFNTDDHAKNHAFLYRKGKWSLSPAFDITFWSGTPGAEAIRAMPILGQSSGITIRQMLKAAERGGLTSGRRIAEEVLTSVIESRKTFTAHRLDLSRLDPVLQQIITHAESLKLPRKLSRRSASGKRP